jgi:uncharacterized protein YggT (Ycf19 family)
VSLILLGWGLSFAVDLWILLIVFDQLSSWVLPRPAGAAGWRSALGTLTYWPINWIRQLFPTVFRGADLSPWITLLVLVLVKALVLRALVYWGVLHSA